MKRRKLYFWPQKHFMEQKKKKFLLNFIRSEKSQGWWSIEKNNAKDISCDTIFK